MIEDTFLMAGVLTIIVLSVVGIIDRWRVLHKKAMSGSGEILFDLGSVLKDMEDQGIKFHVNSLTIYELDRDSTPTKECYTLTKIDEEMM